MACASKRPVLKFILDVIRKVGLFSYMDPPNPFSLKLLKKSATSSEMLLFSQRIKAAHTSPELYIFVGR